MIACSADYVEKYNVTSLFLNQDTLMYISDLGKVFVSVFVFISAYGISVGLDHKKDVGSYLSKRIKKLYSCS